MTFDEVYDEHFDFVWRSLRHLGVGDCDAADATQDVFIVVHAKLADFKPTAKVSTWLYAICINIALSRRSRAYLRREISSAELQDAVDDRVDIGSEVERRNAAEVLARILDEMPDDQRTVFTLFELEELSGDQIAETLDLPVGTVRSRLRLAREAFGRSVARVHARDRFRLGGREATP